jgi:hypothetical protein
MPDLAGWKKPCTGSCSGPRPIRSARAALQAAGISLDAVSAGRAKREFSSGPHLSAKAMLKKLKELTKHWSYDLVSVGYPGPVVRAHLPGDVGKRSVS